MEDISNILMDFSTDEYILVYKYERNNATYYSRESKKLLHLGPNRCKPYYKTDNMFINECLLFDVFNDKDFTLDFS